MYFRGLLDFMFAYCSDCFNSNCRYSSRVSEFTLSGFLVSYYFNFPHYRCNLIVSCCVLSTAFDKNVFFSWTIIISIGIFYTDAFIMHYTDQSHYHRCFGVVFIQLFLYCFLLYIVRYFFYSYSCNLLFTQGIWYNVFYKRWSCF